MDGRYCKLHFLEQRIKKVTPMHVPLDTKSTRKLCMKSQKLPKAKVKKTKHSFDEQNGFLTWHLNQNNIYKQYCLQLDIALWCKNQIKHSIWDESLLFSNCARSLEYSSSSTLAGLSYHICGKLELAFKASPSSQHQHCTDEAQKAETVLSAVI